MKFLSDRHEGDLMTPQVRVRVLLLLRHRWLFHLL